MSVKRISIGGDHAGYPLKRKVVEVLKSWGCDFTDHGTFSEEPVDFPDIAQKVCDQVRSGQAERGILVCGTGVGACMAANKIPGIRAAIAHDIHCAHQCVEHDDANMLCIGNWIIGEKVAEEVIRAYLDAKFDRDDPAFVRRVQKLADLERKGAKEILEK